MFKSFTIFIFVVCLCVNNTSLYSATTKDSTERTFFPKTYGEKKWKILFGLDARRSYYKDQKVKINGLRIGAQYKGVHRFGLGFYALSESIVFKNITIDEPDALNPSDLRVTVGFTTLFYERVLFKVPKWEVSLPANLGKGKIHSEYRNNLGNYTSLSNTPFSVLALGVSGKYYIFSWLAPRITLGHRFTYNNNEEIKKAFNKPFYALGLSISLGELYKSIFKKEDV